MSEPAKAEPELLEFDLSFSCGVDIGEKNMAFGFVNRWGRVVHYKQIGDTPNYKRTEVDQTDIILSPENPENQYDALIKVLEAIPEFKETNEVMIELQLAKNNSNMSRLDGMIYAFLRGRYKDIKVTLNSSTIRKKFINDRFTAEGIDIESVDISKALKPSNQAKIDSLKYVNQFYPEVWDYNCISENGNKVKMDDICDTVVYADLAYAKAHPAPKVRKPRAKRATR